MKTVRLRDNIVVEIIPEYALPVEKWYGLEFAAQCIEAPDDVEQGWVYDGNSFSKVIPEPEPESTPEPIKETKTKEMSSACNQAIESGTTVTMSDGTEKHFTYSLADQSNVSEMFNALIAGATEYPYHADGEECMMYSAKDIVIIYSNLSMFKTGQITYQNQLKQYINSLTDETTIQGIQYGDVLTGEYLTKYNNLMAQAQIQMNKVLANIATSNPSLAK